MLLATLNEGEVHSNLSKLTSSFFIHVCFAQRGSTALLFPHFQQSSFMLSLLRVPEPVPNV